MKNIDEVLSKAKFTFAKTMSNIPHSYTLKKDWEDKKEFEDAVLFIQNNGVPEKFFSKTFVYYYTEEYKYWTMGEPLFKDGKEWTYLINRAKL